MMKGRGVSYGAVTVVNALAIGFGAAIGINLPVKVEVKLTSEPILDLRITVRSSPINSDDRLAKAVLEVIRDRYKFQGGAVISIDSMIPPAKGLKSSSAVANALVLAFLNALNIRLAPQEVIKLGVEAAFKAGVTLTGAYDDATASLLGGLCITDNNKMKLIKRNILDSFYVAILIPRESVETRVLKYMDFSIIKPIVKQAMELVLEGKWMEAMILNGMIYSNYLGYGTKPITDALINGAIAAGLSGKGPSFFALAKDLETAQDIWSEYGEEVIITRTR
jgi:shikimate kinase